jgi:hypothetical protein
VSTDPLTYILSCLRRAADNAYPWSLTPTEAGAMVAEVERLRAQRVLDNEALARAWDEGRDAERGATVAHLRAQAEMAYDNTHAHHALWLAAEAIEHGYHRTGTKP